MPNPTPKLTVVRWLEIGGRIVPEFKMEISDEAMREGLEQARTLKAEEQADGT